MAIIELLVDIIGGSGGPNGNAIPVYGDNKAPFGNQVIGPNGKQLMLENSKDSGVMYIIVDPSKITPEENQGSKFITWKPTGQPNYCRLWIYNPVTKEGEDYMPGVAMWVEYSHLQEINVEPPPTPPPSGDKSILEIDWVNRTVTVKPA